MQVPVDVLLIIGLIHWRVGDMLVALFVSLVTQSTPPTSSPHLLFPPLPPNSLPPQPPPHRHSAPTSKRTWDFYGAEYCTVACCERQELRVGGGGGGFWLRFTEIRFRDYTSGMGGVGWGEFSSVEGGGGAERGVGCVWYLAFRGRRKSRSFGGLWNVTILALWLARVIESCPLTSRAPNLTDSHTRRLWKVVKPKLRARCFLLFFIYLFCTQSWSAAYTLALWTLAMFLLCLDLV